MSNGRSRNRFAHILRFLYFTMSACSLVWMLANYGGVNFVSTMILLPAFGYLALHLISLINLVKKDKFLVGSSVDVLSLGAQRFIHRVGLVLPIPILLYVAAFGFCVSTYNEADANTTARVNDFASCEQAIFGKSVIWNYLSDRSICRYPAVVPVAEPLAADDSMRSGVDFQPYMKDMQRRIRRAWFPPTCSNSECAKVKFKVDKYGYVSELELVRQSSSGFADDAALNAVRNAHPFKPLPEGSPSKVDVEFSFDYNVFTESKNDAFTSAAYSGIQIDPIGN
ncbi:MAG: TonB family protein [Candidatus Obscuribacterales bacterium]|nr:TonB family protein [Candidatus Obscuribacterales bacterium]